MGQPQHRTNEVAKTLGRFIKADLAEGLSLALIHRKFPGISRDELLRVLDICKDEATLEYERTQEMLASMGEMTAGFAALFGLLDLWRSHSKEQRRAISDASGQLAEMLDKLQAQLVAAPTEEGLELLASLYTCRISAGVTNPKSTSRTPIPSCAATSRLLASRNREGWTLPQA